MGCCSWVVHHWWVVADHFKATFLPSFGAFSVPRAGVLLGRTSATASVLCSLTGLPVRRSSHLVQGRLRRGRPSSCVRRASLLLARCWQQQDTDHFLTRTRYSGLRSHGHCRDPYCAGPQSFTGSPAASKSKAEKSAAQKAIAAFGVLTHTEPAESDVQPSP